MNSKQRASIQPHSPFTPLLNNKIVDYSKLEAFADVKVNVTGQLKFVLERVENIAGEGENVGYQHFSPFSKKPSYFRIIKTLDQLAQGQTNLIASTQYNISSP